MRLKIRVMVRPLIPPIRNIPLRPGFVANEAHAQHESRQLAYKRLLSNVLSPHKGVEDKAFLDCIRMLLAYYKTLDNPVCLETEAASEARSYGKSTSLLNFLVDEALKKRISTIATLSNTEAQRRMGELLGELPNLAISEQDKEALNKGTLMHLLAESNMPFELRLMAADKMLELEDEDNETAIDSLILGMAQDARYHEGQHMRALERLISKPLSQDLRLKVYARALALAQNPITGTDHLNGLLGWALSLMRHAPDDDTQSWAIVVIKAILPCFSPFASLQETFLRAWIHLLKNPGEASPSHLLEGLRFFNQYLLATDSCIIERMFSNRNNWPEPYKTTIPSTEEYGWSVACHPFEACNCQRSDDQRLSTSIANAYDKYQSPQSADLNQALIWLKLITFNQLKSHQNLADLIHKLEKTPSAILRGALMGLNPENSRHHPLLQSAFAIILAKRYQNQFSPLDDERLAIFHDLWLHLLQTPALHKSQKDFYRDCFFEFLRKISKWDVLSESAAYRCLLEVFHETAA